MTKSHLLILLILIPVVVLGQKKNNQRLAEITYSSIQKKLSAPMSDRRDASVKMLNGILEMATKKEFINKINDHKEYLERLEYFEIPKVDVSRINDSIANSKDLAFEKVNNTYFIEPNGDFKKVLNNNKTGMYLYIYINENSNMFLEFVNYTNGKLLYIEKAALKFDDTQFEYYLSGVKSRDNGFESCTIESNTKNFIDLFKSVSNHQGTITIEFTGKNGNRTATLPKEITEQIKNVFDLYSELKVKD
ncbi:hypothetical protein ABN763_12980 [Spongiivirga sp. MCCC 1A20706]|uniref:hypothetical protein n=1 Tax=Spongiivirga sp. MCCC 1A20706 TaxID=3160963 RepID=UPI00397764EE